MVLTILSGIPAISIITVNDTTIPALSITRAPDTLAGKMAEFVITSSIPFNKSLNVVYNPSNVGGDHLNESDGDTAGTPNRRSGLDRTIELDFAESNGSYTATLSFATQDAPDDNDGGAINVELKTNAGEPGKYTVGPGAISYVTVLEIPVPELTVITRTPAVNEGSPAEIIIEASENPRQPVAFSYTPTETGSTYLVPTHEGVAKTSGQTREVELTFVQDTNVSGDPWRATLSVATQQAEAVSGTISVVIDPPSVGEKYTVGAANSASVTVNDVSVPELSIANASETLAGSNAQFVVTSSIPFTGNLNVVYTPVVSEGNFLVETDGTNDGPNKNSGEDRTIPLTFAGSSGSYTATLSFATKDDTTDANGQGIITVTL